MKYLNAQQLGFILEIKKNDARAKMCVAWCNDKKIENKAYRDIKDKVVDDYPTAMPIDMLSKELNLPTLQASVDDIVNNYLTRPATRKWILCDFPEKLIKAAKEKGTPPKTNLPPALKSMLPKTTQEIIIEQWKIRFPEFNPKKEEVNHS